MKMELRKNISMNNNTVKRLDDRIENIGVRNAHGVCSFM